MTDNPSGEIQLNLQIAPVSQQSKAMHKAVFSAAIKAITSKYKYILSGDVAVDVEWSVHQQERYETDRAADVDNILKPLIDALVGPDGLIIDDNQIQHVACRWIDAPTTDQSVQIRLQHAPDDCLSKSGLYFGQLEGGLCVPLSQATPIEWQIKVLTHYEKCLATRNEAIASGVDYYTASAIMPIQRAFHRSRVGKFKIIPADQILLHLRHNNSAFTA